MFSSIDLKSLQRELKFLYNLNGRRGDPINLFFIMWHLSSKYRFKEILQIYRFYSIENLGLLGSLNSNLFLLHQDLEYNMCVQLFVTL